MSDVDYDDVGVPDDGGRRAVLGIHTRGLRLGSDVDLTELARATHGFAVADLEAFVQEAARLAIHSRTTKPATKSTAISKNAFDSVFVSRSDFATALMRIRPSAMYEILVQTPEISWADIGGLSDAQQKLREGVELPLRHPEAFRRLGIRPAKGFLLYGPPGTGKTLLAKAVARESGAKLIAIRSSALLSLWTEGGDQQISRIFARARQVAPCVIFIDEMDSLVPARGVGAGDTQQTERIVNRLLVEMDSIEDMQSVVVIGATNRPTLIDPALMRPGRLDELIHVGVPDSADRLIILKIHTHRMPLAKDVDLDDIARRADKFTPADLEDLTRRAGQAALSVSVKVKTVTQANFDKALLETHASVTAEIEKEYANIQTKLKTDAFKPSGIGFITPGMLAPRGPKA